MKKILLSLMLMGSFVLVKAQLVLNEIYPDPSIPPNEEYIELFNTGSGTINIDCYTLVTYAPGNPSSIWVYDLPYYDVGPFGFVVFASNVPINYQGNEITGYSGSNAFSWNDGGSLKKYTISGTSLNLVAGATSTTDLIPITGGNSTTLNIMVFDGSGNLVTGFFANNSHQIPVEVINLGTQNGIGACGKNLQFGDAATNVEVFDLNQAPGNDNGYRRKNNGFCGTWEKAEPASSYSPGTSNGTPAIDPATLSIAALPQCYKDKEGNNNPNVSTWTVVMTVTQSNLLPAHYIIYEDTDGSGDDNPNAGDLVMDEGDITTTDPVQVKFETKSWVDIYIQINTNSNCIEELRHVGTQCAALPITLKSFNAVRSGSNVNLTWQTAIEDRNKGFEIQRFIGAAGGWEAIGFVATQAEGGNSNSILNYAFTDLNNTVKGISQYRLKQVDIDTRASYSFIRSVRGLGQSGLTIVYPNPSSDGKVNIVFQDAGGTRDISVNDMSGRIVKQMRGITNNNIVVDNLVAGMYSVRIVNNETGEQEVQKFVVNKR